MDYLLREQAPLTSDQWARIDETVTETARQALTGRRFIPLSGPFGPGVQALPHDAFDGTGTGAVDRTGESAVDLVRTVARSYVPLPLIYKDFMIHWRDIETSRQQHVPLDVSPAAIAAMAVARAEDELIFYGRQDLGLPGLLTAPGRIRLPMRDWGVVGQAFDDVVLATQRLVEEGFYGPYALVVSPRLYALLHRVLGAAGVLEIEQVQKLMRGGVYQTPVLPESTALVVATGASNMDLAVAQDLTVAYLSPQNLNHLFRVLESVALRIKRPAAVCQVGGEEQPREEHRP